MPVKLKTTSMGMPPIMSNVVVGTVISGISAAGTTQATATIMSLDDQQIITTVAAGSGVAFYPGTLGLQAQYSPGDSISISNYGANPLYVYPATGGSIGNGAVNAPFTIPITTTVTFDCIDGLSWTANTFSSATGIIGPASGSGTMILQSGVDTLVGRHTTDTLANKTLSGAIVSGVTTLPGNGSISSLGYLNVTGVQVASAVASFTYDAAVNAGVGFDNSNSGNQWVIGDGVGGTNGQFNLYDYSNLTNALGITKDYVNLVRGSIRFPASQIASANVNDLDDYVEGTFVPTLTFGGGSTGMTFSTQTGTYTKIGNRVFFDLQFIFTAKGSSTGTLSVGGLPFTTAARFQTAAVYTNVLSGVSGGLVCFLPTSGTTIRVFYTGTGTNTELADTNFNNTSNLFISGNYGV